jgi:tetratricopeptide (TPR) repeat protein
MTAKEEVVGLDIQELNNIGSMRNRVFKYIGFCLLLLVSTSCAVLRKTDDKKEEAGLSEKKLVEYQYTFVEANRAKLTGNFQLAIALFTKSLEINRESDAAAYELSNLYSALGDNEKATQYARLALQLDSSNKWYYFQLARIYQSTEQRAKAVDVYKILVKQFPGEIAYRITLSGLMADDNQLNDALKTLEEIEKEAGLNEKVSVLKHNIHIRNGNYEKAFQEINQLIKHYPEEIRFLGMLAELYGRLGMEKQALETYQKMFSIDPDNGMTHFSVAEFYVGRGRHNESFKHYARAFRDENIELGEKISSLYSLYNESASLEEHSVELGQLVELLISLNKNVDEVRFLGADFFIRSGNYKRAIFELKEIVKVNPENYGVNEQLVILLSYLNEYDDLVQYGKSALTYFSDKSIIWYFYGIGLYQTERLNDALEAFEKGIATSRENDEIKINLLLMLADTYNKLEDYQNSDRCFQEVLEIDNENVVALNNYAYYLSLRETELDKAESMSKITIVKEPENSTYLDTYAWILYKKGKYEEALKFIEKAIEFLDEENAEVIEHFGDILIKNGQSEKAIEMWKKAFDIDNERIELLERIKEHEN